MADTHLTKTFASAGNRKTFTFSVWLKQGFALTSGNSVIFSAGSASNTYCQIRMKNPNNYIQFEDEQGGSVTATPYTDAFFRDPSAWNHLVVRVDSTQSTAADRVRMYMNGTQLTMSGGTQPGQNQDFVINNNTGHALGTLWRGSDSGGHWNGHMAQAIFCDGQSLAPTSFGSTNSDGVWIPNASPSVTYGTNGFKIDFKGTGASADTSGFGADSSGNNNHFATVNIGTNPSSKDSPENNFATWNPNIAFRTASFASSAAGSITDAGLKAVGGGGANSIAFASTIAVNSGKWYAEFKAAATDYTQFGVGDAGTWTNTYGIGGASKAQIYGANVIGWDRTIYYINSTSSTSGGTTFSDGDICQIAIDADTRKVWFGVNGTYNSSGNPAGGSNEIGTVTGTGPLVFLCRPESTNVLANFGNSPFTISSTNADANGYGNFEYAVPSGYYALCTKNLAQYGG